MARISKTIHYCWFGRNPHPDMMVRCIESWRKFCPDYEIREWNEDNFDITGNLYVKQAHDAKKWAFITDYVRLFALYTEGGIYMDTDVELIKPLDDFLGEKGFSGFESNQFVSTGLMAAEKGHPFIEELLREYDRRTFLREDGTLDCTTNVETITAAAKRHGLKQDGSRQTVCDFTFYPSEYFSPIDFETEKLNMTADTYAIHHFIGSWLSEEERMRQNRYRRWVKLTGKRMAGQFMRLEDSIRKQGLFPTIGKIIKKVFLKAGLVFERLLKKLIKLFPVRDNVLFFESEGDYTDNARALYEYMLENCADKKFTYVWKVTNADLFKNKYRNKRTVFVDERSFSGRVKLAYYVAVSRAFFFTHPYWLRKWKPKQTVINLWHGCGYKKAKGNADVGKTFDYTTVTGELYRSIHAEVFNCPIENVLPLGHPRNDYFFDKPDTEAYLKLDIPNGYKCILWMPTFRKSKNSAISDDILNNQTGLPLAGTIDDLKKINAILAENKLYMIIKLHHLQDEQEIARVSLNNIRIITDDMLYNMDTILYRLIPFADALLTDYSSIAIDYLLLDRPIGFTLDDFEQFNNARGFIFEDALSYMPGHHLYKTEDFIRFLLDVAEDRDPYKMQRESMRRACYTYADGDCSRRIADRFVFQKDHKL